MRLESTGKFWRVFSTAVLGLALTACGIANSNTAMPGAQQPIDTTAATACAPFGASYIRTTLYFGLSHPSGVVSDASWQSFLRDEITPRFPNGLTVWEADGQWRGADGALVRERTKVVSLVHAEPRRPMPRSGQSSKGTNASSNRNPCFGRRRVSARLLDGRKPRRCLSNTN
jgi:Protein of unknown function (DUF3574)